MAEVTREGLRGKSLVRFILYSFFKKNIAKTKNKNKREKENEDGVKRAEEKIRIQVRIRRITMKILGWGGSVNTTSKSTHDIKEERTKNSQRESKCSSVSSLIVKRKICCAGLKKPISSEFKQINAGFYEKSGKIKVLKIGNSPIWAKTGVNLKGLGCDVTRWCVKGKGGRGGKNIRNVEI
jgi:hypothetical protein